MNKFTLNEKGVALLLTVAAIVILISSISSISLMGLVRFDNMQVRYANDIIQTETLLRSEQSRTNLILQDNEGSFDTSGHTVEIDNSGRSTYYKVVNHKSTSGQTKRIGTTLITVKHGNKISSNDTKYDGSDYSESPIRRYAETELSGKSLAQYQYFTMYENSENDEYTDTDRVKFYGGDVLNGPVHSNTDIYIQNAGGWPTFNALVTTHGIIMNWNGGNEIPAVGSAPMEEIFLGGYKENTAYINMSEGRATAIRSNGFPIDESSQHDVMYAKITGTNVIYKFADIVTVIDTFTVYNSFPDRVPPNFQVGDSIWTNYIPVKSYEWQEGENSIQISNGSVMVYCNLWIEGNVGSAMTFGCSDTIFITGDLTYEGVTPGQPPDLVENNTNILGLVSEARIYIQYKNYDPWLEEIQNDNCTSIFLYGCFGAIGNGDIEVYGNLNTHYEGIFSFNYQHPHGSTPGFEMPMPNGSVWEVLYPDFHKYVFPPSPWFPGLAGFQLHGGPPILGNNGFNTCGYPASEPASYESPNPPVIGTDWPWYNPVWPEGSNRNMGERGDIIMFGGVQQFRRGYVHRSGEDVNNHSGNDWNIEHWQYDGMHGTTGYDKDYNWDNRITGGLVPPNYPDVYEGMGNAQLYYSTTGWSLKAPPRN